MLWLVVAWQLLLLCALETDGTSSGGGLTSEDLPKKPCYLSLLFPLSCWF